MTWQQWTNKTILIILNQSTFKDMCPPNHKHSAACKESQPPRRCCMQHFWVSTAVPLNTPTVSRNSSGVAQRAEVFRSDVILAENLQGAPSHLFLFVQIKQGPVKQNKRAHRGSQHCGKKESSSLSFEIQVSKVLVAFSHQVFCLFHSCRHKQQTQLSAGEWQNCTSLHNGESGKQNLIKEIYQRIQEVPRPLLAHSHALKHIHPSLHKDAFREHT